MASKAYRKAFGEVLGKGLVEYNERHRVLWIPKYIERNEPGNPNVLKSWWRIFSLLPDCDLKAKCYQAIKAFAEAKSKAFAKAFMEAFPKDYPKESGNMALSPSLSPSLSLSLSESLALTEKAAPARDQDQKDFEMFWEAYGKKVGKKETQRQWKAKIKAGVLPPVSDLIVAVSRYCKSEPDAKFRLDPERWIKHERWNDEPEKATIRETPQQRERREQIEAADRRVKEAEEKEIQDGNRIMRVEGRATFHGGISEDEDDGLPTLPLGKTSGRD
ncbi:MAG: hypothetical protein U9Q07_03745 [Planctomycetota bacterium]|nr:hypothetical protein [Planctomycetota bacterium]